MIIPITPCPAPRMTQSDKWRKRPCVLRYRAFRDELRRHIKVEDVPIPLFLSFYIPMPASWSGKKKLAMCGKPHLQKPDIDNLVKAFMDSLFENDSHVWAVSARKRWGINGEILIDEWRGLFLMLLLVICNNAIKYNGA